MGTRLTFTLATLIAGGSGLFGQQLALPRLDCWEPWVVKGSATLQAAASAGSNSANVSVAFGESGVSLMINHGGANAEAVVTTNTSASPSPLAVTPALQFNHQAGEPIQWSVTYMKSYWGYFNPTSTVATNTAGSSTNFFSPGNPNAGQPSSFPVGFYRDLFATISRSSRDLIWILGDQIEISRAIPELRCQEEFGITGKSLSLARGRSYFGAVIGALKPNSTLDPQTVFSVTDLMVSSTQSPFSSPTQEISVSNVRVSGSQILGDLVINTTAGTGSYTMNLRASLAGRVLDQAGVFLDVFGACPSFAISPNALPTGQMGGAYPPTQLTASGATGPFSLVLESGSLPQGMNFSSGLLSGIPQEAGGFPLTIRATSFDQCLTTLSTQLTIGGPGCAAVVSPQVTSGGFRLNLATGRWLQTVTIRNGGPSAITGPVALVLDNLSANASLFNAAGTTSCAAPLGRPYALVNVGLDAQLAPGETATVGLEFINAVQGQPITYTPRVLAGGSSR